MTGQPDPVQAARLAKKYGLRRSVEVLAPAGDGEALRAAVFAGANAVYLGLKQFSARRTAGNFDAQQLKEAVAFCHARDVRVHAAVNTTAFSGELGLLADTIRMAAEAGVDALIVQDLATAALARQMAPGLALHGSTQLTVHTLSGVRQLAEMGFERAILARELSLAEIAAITKESPIEIEVFVHGALCMSVSGQCYMSAFLGGRSGNRGECAGPCRLPFAADGSGAAHLSLKDLCAVGSLPALAEAGVASVKIEGRLRGPEYVAAAVNACRKSLAGEAVDKQQLQDVFSRSGFTNGYIEGKISGAMFGVRTPEDTAASRAAMPAIRELYRREAQRVPVAFTVTVAENGCTLAAADGAGRRAEAALAGAMEPARASQRPAIEKALAKTGGTPFYSESVDFEGEPGYLPASAWNDARRAVLEQLLALRSAPKAWNCAPARLPAARRHALGAKQLWARFEGPEQLPAPLPGDLAGTILPLLRWREVPEALRAKTVLEAPRVMFGGMEAAAAKALAEAKDAGFAGVMVHNIGHLPLAKGWKLYGGFGLNVANPLSALCWKDLGLSALTVSPETPFAEMEAIEPGVPTWAIVYGHLPLMITRACPLQNVTDCAHCDKQGLLTDRKRRQFPVRCGGGVRQIYNPVPLYMGDKLKKLPADGALAWFTLETPAEAARVLAALEKGESWPEEFTRGLYFKTPSAPGAGKDETR